MRQIYLLPNLITTGNLFCGVYAIIMALNGRMATAAWAILAAMLFDFFDGQVARLKKATSRFGVEYDSLSDLVSFALAPSIIVYIMFLKDLGRLGFGLVFAYIVCAALRLARFNIQKTTLEKKSFSGLPTPASAGFIATGIMVMAKDSRFDLKIFAPMIMLFLSLLMVSTIKYPSLGMINLWKKRPFLNLVSIIICGSMMLLHLELFLFLCFAGYIVIGVIRPKQLEETVLMPEENDSAEESYLDEGKEL